MYIIHGTCTLFVEIFQSHSVLFSDIENSTKNILAILPFFYKIFSGLNQIKECPMYVMRSFLNILFINDFKSWRHFL